jgi:hypothetical protein
MLALFGSRKFDFLQPAACSCLTLLAAARCVIDRMCSELEAQTRATVLALLCFVFYLVHVAFQV